MTNKIENPLDKYRSYAYHHILLVANTTEGIKNVSNNNLLSKIAGKKLGEEIDSGVYLIVDTRKTSEFQIETLTYDVLLLSGSKTQNPLDNVIVGGLINMKLIDPSGIGFFNYMHYLVNEKLKTDFTGLTFLLHTVFVGHTHDNKTEYLTEYCCTLPLALAGEFSLSEFTHKGGIYDMQFVCVNNGANHLLKNVSSVPDVMHINVKDGRLGNAIQSLENQLNLKSLEFYLNYNPQYKNSDGSISGDQSQGTVKKDKAKNVGRLVQYMITIPESWFYFWVDTPVHNFSEKHWPDDVKEQKAGQSSTTTEEQAPTDEDTSYDNYITSQAEMNITDILGMIFTHCPDINALLNLDKKREGTGKTYKILTSITSNLETLMIHYDVVEYDLPDVNQQAKIAESSKNKADQPTRNNGITPENSLEYDYYFSGKNNHILEMEIKANMLFAALMTNATIGQEAAKITQKENQEKKAETPAIEMKTDFNSPGDYQPLIRPPITNTQASNMAANINKQLPQSRKRAEDVQHFHRSLADLNAVSVQPTVKIRGNPLLLGRYILEDIPEHVVYGGKIQDYANIAKDSKQYNTVETSWEYDIKSKSPVKGSSVITSRHIEHRKFVEEHWVKPAQKQVQEKIQQAEQKSFVAGGTFAKINIFAPRDYPFNRGATSENDNLQSYKQQFFYDSWYIIAQINNTFSDGIFTQELHLLSYDVYGKYGVNQPTSAEKNEQ